MKMEKTLVLILVFMLILPSISLIASSQGGNSTDVSKESIIYRLLRFRFGFLNSFSMGRYFVLQLRPPTPIQAYPESISLNYLNETTFQIGGKNLLKPLEWQSMIAVAGGWSWGWMDKQITFYFEFVPPDNMSKDIWNVQFDPPKLVIYPNTKNLNWSGAEAPFKTNVTIMLKPSVDPSIVTQDTVLKVNIVKEEVLDKFTILKGAPEFLKTHKEEYIQKCNESGELPWFYTPPSMVSQYNLYIKYFIFLMNLGLPLVEKKVDSTVEALIKVNKYHLAEVTTPPLPIEIEPYEVKSIPVTIKNIGSHIDSYNFRVNCSDKNMIVTPPPAITLKPGEEGTALVGVAAPKTFAVAGSITSIFVDVYSVDDPKTVFSNTIILATSGINVSGGSTYAGVLLLIILFIIIALYLYFSKKRREKFCKKPEKPWKIPEEKEYLEKLKEKNKEEYKKVLEMMKEEYESALLWYKSYLEAMIKKEKQEKQKARTVTAEKKLVEKPKAKKIEEKKPIETMEDEIEKTLEKPAAKIEFESAEERKKQEAILKIKREQEKQRKKFKTWI